jgi:hypothetical protein
MSRRRSRPKPIENASPSPQASDPKNNGGGTPAPSNLFPIKRNPWKSMEFWLLAGTWVLAIVSIVGLRESRNAIAISERAWVAPVDARLDEPIQKDKPIKVVVLLENSGKEPALNVQNVANGGITLPFSAEEAAQEQLIGPGPQLPTVCTGFPKPAGAILFHSGITIYPSTVQHLQTSIADSFVADQGVLSGGRTFFVHGCAAYDTIDGPHSSEYCFFLGSRVDVTTGIESLSHASTATRLTNDPAMMTMTRNTRPLRAALIKPAHYRAMLWSDDRIRGARLNAPRLRVPT